MYVLELGGSHDAFAAREAASAASDVTLVGAGLATARGITDRVATLAVTHRASELVARCEPDVADARAALQAAAIDRAGSVAVRADDRRSTTGVDTQRVERELGQVLVDRGFAIDLDDPDHELRALFAGPPGSVGSPDEPSGTDAERGPRHDADANADADGGANADSDGICALGWLAVESDRSFAARKPTERPFFQPGGMDPTLARAVCNLAGARAGRVVLDPMCGTGGMLAEAARVGADVIGTDAQAKMVRGTRQNLAAELDADGTDVDANGPGVETGNVLGICRADARRLPFGDGAVDAAVFDVPYGRQSKIESESLATLVADALAETYRVADRAVVVGDRDWSGTAGDAGWTVADRFERRVHRSLVRHVHVLR